MVCLLYEMRWSTSQNDCNDIRHRMHILRKDIRVRLCLTRGLQLLVYAPSLRVNRLRWQSGSVIADAVPTFTRNWTHRLILPGAIGASFYYRRWVMLKKPSWMMMTLNSIQILIPNFEEWWKTSPLLFDLIGFNNILVLRIMCHHRDITLTASTNPAVDHV